ncbi:MAG: OsmC family protein [Acidobacteriaceae bacterium]
MVASAVWQGEERFSVQSDSGRAVVLDGSPEHTAGPSPMEMVLGALCACTSVDVVSILKKKREALEGLTVTAQAERAPGSPSVFTHIHLTYRIRGTVSKKGAEDAVSLSKNKYCSVSKMLEKAATIDYSIEYES